MCPDLAGLELVEPVHEQQSCLSESKTARLTASQEVEQEARPLGNFLPLLPGHVALLSACLPGSRLTPVSYTPLTLPPIRLV